MNFKKGNTYNLSATIKGVDIQEIDKIVFQFNEIKKTYLSDAESDITYNEGVFIVPLSQEDTLKLKKDVSYEVAVKFKSGEVKRSEVKQTDSLITIIEEAI